VRGARYKRIRHGAKRAEDDHEDGEIGCRQARDYPTNLYPMPQTV
jgi:hypothetical protein